MNRAENITEGQPNRELLGTALILQSPSQNAAEAFRIIKNIPEKADATRNMCAAFAFNNEIFNAQENILPLISASDLSFFNWQILYGYNEANNRETNEWREYDDNYYTRINLFIKYIDENN